MPLSEKDKLDYAWNWFEYHAAQRLTTFRYFLILFGILLLGYFKGMEGGYYLFMSTIGYVGAFISLAFLSLEVRNEKLVNVGRDALIEVENTAGLDDESKIRLLTLDRKRNPSLSHKLWLRMIYILSIFGFIIAAYNPNILISDNTRGEQHCPTSHKTEGN